MEVSEQVILDHILAGILQVVDPDRVLLFGSRARDEHDADSDFDVFIVAPSSLPTHRRAIPIYRAIGASKDLVWRTPEEVDDWRNVRGHLINRVLREGKVIYERLSDAGRIPTKLKRAK